LIRHTQCSHEYPASRRENRIHSETPGEINAHSYAWSHTQDRLCSSYFDASTTISASKISSAQTDGADDRLFIVCVLVCPTYFIEYPLTTSASFLYLAYQMMVNYKTLVKVLEAGRRRTSEVCIQTEAVQAPVKSTITKETQTECVITQQVGTSVELETTSSKDYGCQTETPLDCESLEQPPTPSTVDVESHDEMIPVNRLRSTTVEEEKEFNYDTDAFLMSTMQDVLSDAIEEKTTDPMFINQSIMEVRDWDVPSAERISTTCTENALITTGEIYMTLETDPDDELAATYGHCSSLSSSLQMHLAGIRPSKAFVASVSSLVNEISVTLTRSVDPDVSVVPYGSIASNLSVDGTRVDLLIIIPLARFESMFSVPKLGSQYTREIPLGNIKEYELRQMMRKALSRIGEVLVSDCGFNLVKLTNTAPVSSIHPTSRVPILTVSDPISNVSFDICCNHIFPAFSTRLLKAYNNLLPSGELRDFVILVKHWARQKGVLSTQSVHGLSGFSWTLLCVFYCQSAIGLVPSLQSMSTERQQWKDPFGSNRRCDVGFDETCIPVSSGGGFDGASLFIGFLDYLANYWSWDTSVVSVRLGRAIPLDSPESFIRHSGDDVFGGLIIEDPFDIKKDLAHGCPWSRIRQAITDSCCVISNGGSVSALLAPPVGKHVPRHRIMTTDM
jgi:hypothetical protein